MMNTFTYVALTFLFILFILPKISLLAPNSTLLPQVFYDPARTVIFKITFPDFLSSPIQRISTTTCFHNSMSYISFIKYATIKRKTTLTELSPLKKGMAPLIKSVYQAPQWLLTILWIHRFALLMYHLYWTVSSLRQEIPNSICLHSIQNIWSMNKWTHKFQDRSNYRYLRYNCSFTEKIWRSLFGIAFIHGIKI